MKDKEQISTSEVVGMIEELLAIDKQKEIEQHAAKLNMTYEQWRQWYRNEYKMRPFTPDSQSLHQIRLKLCEWRNSLRSQEKGNLDIEKNVPLPENYENNPPRASWKKLASQMNVGDSVVVVGWNEATSLKTALQTRWGRGCCVSRKVEDTDSTVYFPVRVWRTK